MKQRLSVIVNYINLLSLLCLTFGLLFPFSPLIQILYYIFFGSYTIEIFTDRKWKVFYFDRSKRYYIAMALFFLLAIIYMPFEKTNEYTLILLERRSALIGFAIIGFLGVNRLYQLKYFLYAFVSASIISILYLLFYRIGIYEFITSDDPSELFTQTRILYIGSHMKLNLYLNISIISIWYILKNNWKNLSHWKLAFFVVALTIILSVLSISEGRTGFMAGVLLLLAFIFIELYTRRKKVGIVFAFILPLLFIGIASNQKRIQKENSIKEDARTFLWKSAWEVIKESPLLGHGMNDAQVAFDEKLSLYQTESFRQQSIESEKERNEKYQDSHNQYLQATMEFGVLGLVLFLFICLYPAFVAYKGRKLFTIFIVSLYIFLSIFDMYITRLYCPVFGILTIMMLGIEQKEEYSYKKIAT